MAKRGDEHAKLDATGLANIGTASLIGGFVAPVFGGHLDRYSLLFAVLYGAGFHIVAHVVLRFMSDE